MFWFGPHWEAPVNDERTHVPTPVGRACYICFDEVVCGDRGVLLDEVSRDGKHKVKVAHTTCLVCFLMSEDEIEALSS